MIDVRAFTVGPVQENAYLVRADAQASHALMINCREVWVYTSAGDHIARDFYLSLDFELIGSACEYANGKTANASDVVLRQKLIAKLY